MLSDEKPQVVELNCLPDLLNKQDTLVFQIPVENTNTIKNVLKVSTTLFSGK